MGKYKGDDTMLYNRKIVIIGAGHVGTHCAAALSFQNICDEIVFIDKDEVKAKSQAMDLADSVCFLPSAPIIRTGDYRDCEDSDIIVISAGAVSYTHLLFDITKNVLN